MRAGRRHGLGTMSFDASPAVYEGEWADSMRHGHGVLYFNPERTAYYDGGCGWPTVMLWHGNCIHLWVLVGTHCSQQRTKCSLWCASCTPPHQTHARHAPAR